MARHFRAHVAQTSVSPAETKVQARWFARPATALAAVAAAAALIVAGDVVGVTIEPKGGSDAPTAEPIVVFESA